MAHEPVHFSIDFQRGPKGDHVRVVVSGKFLPSNTDRRLAKRKRGVSDAPLLKRSSDQPPRTLPGGVVFVGLLCPGPPVVSVVLGLDALPDGEVLPDVDGDIEPLVPLDIEEPDDPLPVDPDDPLPIEPDEPLPVDPLPIEPDEDGDEVDDELSVGVVLLLLDIDPPVVDVLPVVEVVDGFDIELSVFGVSALLQAPSVPAAATAAAMASHLIERSMFAPVCGWCRRVAPTQQRRVG